MTWRGFWFAGQKYNIKEHSVRDSKPGSKTD